MPDDWFQQNAPPQAASGGDWFAQNSPDTPAQVKPAKQSNLSKTAHGFYDTLVQPLVDTAKKASGWDQPDPTTTGGAIKEGLSTITRPVTTAAGMLGSAVRAQYEQGKRAAQDIGGEWDQATHGKYLDAAKTGWSAVEHGIGALTPVIGPMANQITDTAIGNNTPGQPPNPAQADPARATGMAGAAALPLVPKVARAVVGGAAPLIKSGARNAYMSAMKPSTALDQTARAKLFQTAQLEGIPVSEGGLATADAKIDALQKAVKQTIATAPASTAPISKFDVARRLNDTYKTFATQATPQADLDAIASKGNDFLEAQPNQLSLDEAQAKKIGTYNVLRKKGAYGEQSAAGDEAQKALARGLKEELQNRLPELQSLNAREGSLLQLEGALQKAVARIQNVNKVPLRAMVGGAAAAFGGGAAHGGWLEGAAAAGFGGLLAYAIDDPFVKSRLAIALGRASDAMAAASKKATSAAPAIVGPAAYAGNPQIMPPPGEPHQ